MAKEKDEQLVQEEDQILHETVLNEKIATHPTFGSFKFRHPTLKDQKKIDTLLRAKKKELKMAFDLVPDPENPDHQIKIPAYKSREMLKKEFKDIGWWTEENEQELSEATQRYTRQVLELELLGFESEEEVNNELNEIQDKLIAVFDTDITPEIKEAINDVCSIVDPDSASLKLLHDEAPNSTVDDLIEETKRSRLIIQKLGEFVEAYQEFVAIQSEEMSLFSDSWQNQLERISKLIQLFVCTTTEDNKTVWSDFNELEENEVSDREIWLMNEFLYFLRGIPDDLRERMGKYGFFLVPSVKEGSSEQLQEEEKSLPVGDSQGELLEDS